MIKCIITDDEPLAREGIASYVKEVDFLHLTGICENPVELVNLLKQHPADLLFLDIQMPKLSGIDFLKMVQHPPMVVITTAFPEYALEGFQLNVLDYLLKPVTFDRFFKAATKARDYHQLMNPAAKAEAPPPDPEADYFFIKCGTRYEKIQVEDILFVEGMQNYSSIYTKKGKYMTLLYLKNLEQQLPAQSFIRVHKSYIVAVNKIDSIQGNEICIQSHQIPISRNYRESVIQQVVMRKLWDKVSRPPLP
ncbi:LytR/AlgR family response regulator transcription factor [Chitinophaga arvensicola]|uniref:DNA-binding response regulator, LytR/AlgR family n=1 Tax=Chitinophaga arvensicola TaxID=29529 RepID=A0A1I0S8V3_9BACT|nr:LytTR family DNA-binding domain-containing protein [Chitinophaga arvensicola]SEW51331.1 DNA-binding response regulator, LytR/AlgR family [Chitinophaga arvensicola]